jgi:type IV secretory pathway VirB10-like protein
MTDTTQEELPKCELCGEPMPKGEEMFKYHGYSGPCPKPPLPQKEELPPLPEQDCCTHVTDSETMDLFRADQMRDYARLAITTALAQRDAEIAELKQTIGILAEEKEADICRANSAESKLSAAKELLRDGMDALRSPNSRLHLDVADRIDAFLQEKL